MKSRFKKNEKVIVISGKDKGKVGEVLELCNKSDKVKVRGVNMITLHIKPKKRGDIGGIHKREAFVHVSNVMPVDSMTGKPVRRKKIEQSW